MNPENGDSRVPLNEEEPFPTLSSATPVEAIGTMIGRYKLLSVLGQGGFGMVYLAEQQEPIRRKVALKIIKLGMDTRQVIARFEAERQALALMDHPSIAKVLDAGATETGRPYFVMELVRGLSIVEYCDRHKLNIERRLELFLQVCEAIQYAHQKGIIHRDIKPSNILVSAREDRAVPVVIDFGVAKAMGQSLTERTLFTEQGQFLGTPEYMSPEQAEMTAEQVDTRSDIYSLGVVLYGLLAGTLPFDAQTLREGGVEEVRRTLREEEPKTPSTRLSELGEQAQEIARRRDTDIVTLSKRLRRELEWIPLKAMRKEPDRRYRSASDLADDIRNYLDGNPLIAGPETTIYRVQKFVHKHAGSVATIALVAAAIVLGLVVSTVMYFRAEASRVQAEKETVRAVAAEKAEQDQRRVAEQERIEAKQNWAATRRALYFSNINRASIELANGNIYGISPILASCPADLRGWEWHYLWRTVHSVVMDVPVVSTYDRGIWLSQDFRYVVTNAAYTDPTLIVQDAETGSETMLLKGHSGAVTAVAFSQDGDTMVSAGGDNTVRLWSLATASCIKTIEVHNTAITALAFSTDGKSIISGGQDGETVVWDVATGSEVMAVRNNELRGGGGVSSVAYSSGGQRVLVMMGVRPVIYDARDGTLLRVLPAAGYRAALSVDGRMVACAFDSVKILDTETGKVLRSFPSSSHVYCVSFHPDGNRVVWGDVDGMVKVGDLTSGAQEFSAQGPEYQIRSVAFNKDGSKIASSDMASHVTIWTFEKAGTGRPRVLPCQERATSLAFNLEHSLAALACSNDLRILDPTSGNKMKVFDINMSDPTVITISPDGTRVAAARPLRRGPTRRAVKIWDCRTGQEVGDINPGDAVTAVAFGSDGRTIAVGDEGGIVSLWDIERRTRVMAFDMNITRKFNTSVDAIAVAPDGKHVAATGNMIALWDIQSGAREWKGDEGRIMYTVVFSRDGRLLAAGDVSDSATIWDVKSGTRIARCYQGSEVRSLAFSPDGSRIVSADSKRKIRIWDVGTEAEGLTLDAQSEVLSVGFSADGRLVLAGCEDGAIRIWDCGSDGNAVDARYWCAAGLAWYRGSEYDLAISAFTNSLEVDPRNPNAYMYRALSCAEKGEPSNAASDLSKVKQLGRMNLTTLYLVRELANLYAWDNQIGEAERLYREILSTEGEQVGDYIGSTVMQDLSCWYAKHERYEEAMELYSAMLKTCRNGPASWKNAERLSSLYQKLGSYRYAKAAWLMLIERAPSGGNVAAAMNELAWICATCTDADVRNGKEAVRYATQACELTERKNPTYIGTLAAAYAEAGDFDAAVRSQQEAIKLPSRTLIRTEDDRADYEARLKLYQEGKPYRQEPTDTPPARP